MPSTFYTFVAILEASLHSPPWLYHWTVKPPMAPLDHIADIPVVGPELYRVISLKPCHTEPGVALQCTLEGITIILSIFFKINKYVTLQLTRSIYALRFGPQSPNLHEEAKELFCIPLPIN